MSGSTNLKVFLGLIILFTNLSAFSQADKPLHFYFKGKLADYKSGNPVVFANIYNLNSKIGTLSDTSGIFSIPAQLNDILMITCIGYYVKNVKITDSLVKQIFTPYIFLDEKSYELNKVDIHTLGTYEDFKYRILHSKLPDNGMANLQNKIREEIKKMPSKPLQAQASMTIDAPITTIYNLFSKEGKSLRKLAHAKEGERIHEKTAPKYNRGIIEKATGLHGIELDNFILYCQPEEKTLTNMDEFQIYRLIQNYFERYKQKLKSDSIAASKK